MFCVFYEQQYFVWLVQGNRKLIFPACSQLSQRPSSTSCVRFHAKWQQPVLC